jgi:hypothetical protein
VDEGRDVVRKGVGDVEIIRVGVRRLVFNGHLAFCGGCLGLVNIEAFGRQSALFAYQFLVSEDMVVVLRKAVCLIANILKEFAGGCI